jgi:hypothetical protein
MIGRDIVASAVARAPARHHHSPVRPCSRRGRIRGPIARNGHSTALFTDESQSFLDNVIAGFGQIGAWNDSRGAPLARAAGLSRCRSTSGAGTLRSRSKLHSFCDNLLPRRGRLIISALIFDGQPISGQVSARRSINRDGRVVRTQRYLTRWKITKDAL